MTKIEEIKSRVTILDILSHYNIEIRQGDFCNCIFHNEKTASMKVYVNENRIKCFGCGVSADVIQFVVLAEHCSTSVAIALISEWFNINFNKTLSREEIQEFKAQRAREKILAEEQKKLEIIKLQETIDKNKINAVKYIERCRQCVSETTYFYSRGFTDTTIKRFNLGYDTLKKSVVMPYNRANTYYQTRQVDIKQFRKPRAVDLGVEPIFNEFALRHSAWVFVVESPFCAISIMQCGGVAISICGVSNTQKLIRYISANKCKAKLIISLDNDIAGTNATAELEKLLQRIHTTYIIANVADECKDPNELLVKDSNRLEQNIKKVILQCLTV